MDGSLGTAEDLLAHERLLDATAAEAPVLPLRFGVVMTSPTAVVDELLAPHHDEFHAALQGLRGRAEYVIKGRYVEQAVLQEVLEESAEAGLLRDRVRSLPEAVTRDARIRLGEIVTRSITAKRETDTSALLDRLGPFLAAAVTREPSHELDAVHLALLMETSRQAELEQALHELDRGWAGRIELRLLGPLAPYDFVEQGQGG